MEVEMKRFAVRVAIAICAFIVGVAAVIWLNVPEPNLSLVSSVNNESVINKTRDIIDTRPQIADAIPDSTIYSVKFCDLVRDSQRYDGKVVRTQAFYVQGVDTTA